MDLMTIAFISGHLDITKAEFEEHYAPVIIKFHTEQASFVVGDAPGVDSMAQDLLKRLKAPTTVYHMFEKARYNAKFPAVGGFTSDKQRDAALTAASTTDIAWVRPGREKSGTAANISRRKILKDGSAA